MSIRLRLLSLITCLLFSPAFVSTARAQAQLCDTSFEDCRARLLQLIRNETVGIDVAFWFMEDARYSNELIRRWREGLPIRIIVDPRANATYPLNANRLAELAAAGIPMRRRTANGILHWKMMMFDAQNVVQFSAANYSPWALAPVEPYISYVDEVIYFADDPAIVNSFRTKYDSLWINTSQYANYANITTPLVRRYDLFPKDPKLNFVPAESYRNRAVSAYNAETQGIDVTMFRITDRAHTDAMIRAVQRGVPVRLLTEPDQYRDETRYWHAWNVDRLYMAGVQIRHRAHQGSLHQKSVLLHNQGMTIFGSSNWTSASSDYQEEHNYFTQEPWFFTWFVDQFERKWNNLTGHIETRPFTPLQPDTPVYRSPVNGRTELSQTGQALRWEAGYWAHEFDIYFGTTSTPPLYQSRVPLGPSVGSQDVKRFVLPALQPGTTYYWRIVSRTMANLTRTGPVWSFTTEGAAPPPPPPPPPAPGDIVLYAADASVRAGGWQRVTDASAAGGARLAHPDAGAAKIATALPNPTHYFEMTFNAQANTPYRLWIRAKAQSNYWANDSVHVQFSGSINGSGSAAWRIGTTSSAEVNLEDCSGCGLSGWGWQDNGWGVGVLGPQIRFATAGVQTIRVQTREDGLSIDQIVLSPSQYLNTAPGPPRNDSTILGCTACEDGGSDPGEEEPPGGEDPGDVSGEEVVLYAAETTTTAGSWVAVSATGAAEGLALHHPDAGAPKIVTAGASPSHYFELTFDALAGRPYRLWIRGRAQADHWGNDSVHVQFSGSVNAGGSPVWRIGTTSATEVNLEDCSGCGISGWGWQDNGWGVGVLGPEVHFAATGPQTIRIQTREDGFIIDQVVLSSGDYLTSAPGTLTNDATILPASPGS